MSGATCRDDANPVSPIDKRRHARWNLALAESHSVSTGRAYVYSKEVFGIVEGSNIAACHVLRMIRGTEWNSYRRKRGIQGDLLPPGRALIFPFSFCESGSVCRDALISRRTACPRATIRELFTFVGDGHQFFPVEHEHGGSLSGGAVVSPGVNFCFSHNARARMNIMLFYGSRRRISAVLLHLCHRHAGLHDLAAAA